MREPRSRAGTCPIAGTMTGAWGTESRCPYAIPVWCGPGNRVNGGDVTQSESRRSRQMADGTISAW